jgi:hypothetical protein
MHLPPRSLVPLGIVSCFCLLLSAKLSLAQNVEKADAGRPVAFATADGVQISGTFYPPGKRDACVLLLHPIGKGEHSRSAGWDALAQSLNKQGYAVLSFDFRGHGKSTEVEPKRFWSVPSNAAQVRQKKGAPDEISFEDFKPSYFPILVNDIAAAKSFLDRQNDQGNCNTSALILIGAESGGALGSIWLNSEFYRYKFLPAAFPQFRWPYFAEDPEGKGTIAAVFLSISPQLGDKGRPISLEKVLAVPGKANAVPMAFLYGEGDKGGKELAKRLETFLKGKQQFTGAVAVPGAEGAKGRKLLAASLGTDEAIAKYLDNVLEKKVPERINRNFLKSQYAWGVPIRFPGQMPQPIWAQAKSAESLTINFNAYDRFIIYAR